MGFGFIDTIFPGASELIDVGSGAWDSFTGKDQQRSANETNVGLAREQMAFQERMSNTAHVRQVADLEKAGINPILSAKLGGASSPGGALAQVQPLPSAMNKFISTAMDLKRFADDRRVSQSTAANLDASALKTATEADILLDTKQAEKAKGRMKGTAWEAVEKFFNRFIKERSDSKAKPKKFDLRKKQREYKFVPRPGFD